MKSDGRFRHRWRHLNPRVSSGPGCEYQLQGSEAGSHAPLMFYVLLKSRMRHICSPDMHRCFNLSAVLFPVLCYFPSSSIRVLRAHGRTGCVACSYANRDLFGAVLTDMKEQLLPGLRECRGRRESSLAHPFLQTGINSHHMHAYTHTYIYIKSLDTLILHFYFFPHIL